MKYVVAPIKVNPVAIMPTTPKVFLLGRMLENQEPDDYSLATPVPLLTAIVVPASEALA